MPNANDRRQVQLAQTRENAQRKGELEQFRFVMGVPAGRRLMQRMLDMTGADREPPFSPNAMTLAHDAGVRSLGFWLLSEIRQACPEQELVMRNETLQIARRLDLTEEFENEQRDTNG